MSDVLNINTSLDVARKMVSDIERVGDEGFRFEVGDVEIFEDEWRKIQMRHRCAIAAEATRVAILQGDLFRADPKRFAWLVFSSALTAKQAVAHGIGLEEGIARGLHYFRQRARSSS